MTIPLWNSLTAPAALVQQEYRVLLANHHRIYPKIIGKGDETCYTRPGACYAGNRRVKAGCADVTHLIRERKPCAVLFDLGMDQPNFVIPMLREQPSLLLIGLDPSSDELLILSNQPVQDLNLSDLIELIRIRTTQGRRAME